MTQGWITTTLGDSCDLYQPKTISAKELVEGGQYPVFGANGIIGRYDKYNHEESQLLITCRGATCGSINVSEPFSWITGNAMVVRPRSSSINLRFMEYLLRGGIDMSLCITGAAQPQITRTNLAPSKFSYPELVSEQQRIVTILDAAFADIATAKANAKKNFQNARALFESYLMSVLTSKRWKWQTLGELCNRVEYGSSEKSKSEGKMPVLRMGNIQNGKLNWDNLVFTDDEDQIARYELKHNDVLFNRTNSPELVGKTAIYKSERPAIFAGYLIRIHRKDDVLDADYLNYFLNSQIAADYGKTVVISSVNQANINGAKLKGYPIPVPTLEQQRDIVSQLDALGLETQRLESLCQQKLTVLDELKKSLLHQAFSGQL